MESVKTIIGQPMEAERVAVDPDEIYACFERLNSMVDGVPREFSFNMDETGRSSHSDSREVRVIVPIHCGESSAPVPFDRHSRPSTFVACIAADEFRMKSFAIANRVTAEKELQYSGYDASNVTLASQANAFTTTALFELWATTVFPLPSKNALPILHMTVESCFSWMGLDPITLTDCSWNVRLVKFMFLIPHASDQIQPLDLLTFALMKQGFSASKFNRLVNRQSNKAVRMLGAWFGARALHHNVKAFMNVGLIPYERDGRFFLTVVPEKARRVRGPDILEGPARPDFPPSARHRFRLRTGV